MTRRRYKDDVVCGTCRHFVRHYIKWEEGIYHPLSLGHCVYPRVKDRDDNARCPRWEQRSEKTL